MVTAARSTGPIGQTSSGPETINSILSVLTALKGTGTTTETTTPNISREGINAILQQALSSGQGLASVASGQKGVGLYNSSVNQQLLNDLLSRTSGELAKQSAGTTTARRTSAQIDPMKIILGLAAGNVFGPTLKAGAKKAGLEDLPTKLKDLIFGSTESTTAAAGTAGTTSGAGGVPAAGIAEIPALAGAAGIGAALTADGTILSAANVADLIASANATADPLGAFVGSLGFGEAAAGASAGTAAAAAGYAAANAATDAALIDLAGTAATAGEGFGFAELAAALAWIICTELVRQNRMPKRFYVYGQKVFASYPADGKKGYYIWAIPTVRHLRKHPYSLYSRFICTIFNWRAEYLAATQGCKKARKLLRGWLVTHLSYYFCLGLSKFVSEKRDWRVLYG